MLSDLLSEAVGVIADKLALDPHQVDFMTRKLQAAGLLDAEEIKSRLLARQIVAAMASSRPVEAVDAVRAYEEIQFEGIVYARPIYAAALGIEAPHEMICAHASAEYPANHSMEQFKERFGGSLVEAIARHIRLARDGESGGDWPDALSLSRDLSEPHAEFFKSYRATNNGYIRFNYGWPTDGSEREPFMPPVDRLQVKAAAPMSIICELAALLPRPSDRGLSIRTSGSVSL